jgi:2-amino-4-hydroxy-6-hydroxymethyldihydropteridine diphosphokinase
VECWTLIYLGLGTNLGAREENIAEVVSRISSIDGLVLNRVSRIYETSPVEARGQDYYNAVAMAQTTLSPAELLTAAKNIEKSMGRIGSSERGEPRIIDIDILLYGEEVIESPELTLPHPGMKKRLFVLVPMADLTPELVIPGETVTVDELAKEVSSTHGEQRIKNLGSFNKITGLQIMT